MSDALFLDGIHRQYGGVFRWKTLCTILRRINIFLQYNSLRNYDFHNILAKNLKIIDTLYDIKHNG